MNNTMNIYANKGQKVRFSFPHNGYDSDIKHAQEYLDRDAIYTVEETFVSQSSTRVELQEFPKKYFNSVHFEDVIQKREYRPFDQTDIDFLRGKWVVSKIDPSDQCQITYFKTIEGVFYIAGANPQTLLTHYTFLDGSPCGKN
jgi:hypothetical protein